MISNSPSHLPLVLPEVEILEGRFIRLPLPPPPPLQPEQENPTVTVFSGVYSPRYVKFEYNKFPFVPM